MAATSLAQDADQQAIEPQALSMETTMPSVNATVEEPNGTLPTDEADAALPYNEDSRHYTLGKGNLAKRFTYSFTRVAITRTDGGNETFNAAEILGAGAAAGISDLYYPGQERTLTKTYQRWITNILIDGGTFIFKELWPDINNTFFHQNE